MEATMGTESNESEDTFIVYTHDPPLVGYPGTAFYALHYTALVSLTISIVSSVTVFLILRPLPPAFWQRTLGERLSVYLAFGDLCFSISHTVDHAAMMYYIDNPKPLECTIMGFFVAGFILVQMCMVCFIGLNAFILVVRETRLNFGRYDWRFIFGTLVVPLAALTPIAAVGGNGPSGAWCLFDARNDVGRYAQLIQGILQWSVMLVILISYTLVYIKIYQVSAAREAIGTSTGGADATRSANIMMKFVAAYIIQSLPLSVYSFWAMFAPPPIEIMYAAVTFQNAGGFFNLCVYTLLRRMDKKEVKRSEAA